VPCIVIRFVFGFQIFHVYEREKIESLTFFDDLELQRYDEEVNDKFISARHSCKVQNQTEDTEKRKIIYFLHKKNKHSMFSTI